MNSFLVPFTAFIYLLAVLSASAEDIPFAIGKWAPYTGADIPNYGLATEVVAAACQASDLHCVFDFFPWKRAVSMVENGSKFGTFPYQEMPERRDKFQFSNSLFHSSFAILTHRTNKRTSRFIYTNEQSLQNHRIGIIAGTDAIKSPLKKHFVTVEEVPTAYQNLKKLQMHRIDFYIDDVAVIVQALKTHFSEEEAAEFRLLDQSFGERSDFKIMVSMNYPRVDEILAKINMGLNKIRQSGTLDRIFAKYAFHPPPPTEN